MLQTATAWSSALCLLLTVVVQTNLATTPTGLFPVGVGPPKIDTVIFDTVAANATRAVFDASFDQTVEWHDPYLDPGIPSPFSEWSPDFPPQLTAGGFTSWFTNDAGPADSLPKLPVATTATALTYNHDGNQSRVVGAATLLDDRFRYPGEVHALRNANETCRRRFHRA